MIVAITGASGFIGSALAASLRAEGHAVRTIGRGAQSDVRWDPEHGALPDDALDGIDAVVNLAGERIDQRWNAERKRALRESRVRGTGLIAAAAARAKPQVLVSGSAMGIYGSRGDEWLDESSLTGDDFLAGIARAWEGATVPAQDAGVRVVLARTGLVLHPGGGALAKMLPPFRAGLGGPVGDGKQYMSWISRTDAVRALRFAIDTVSLAGPVNVVGPEPVTNADFSHALGRALHRPSVVPVPAFALRLAFGEMAEATVLASQRIRPRRLLEAGFTFAHTTLDAALTHELG